MTPRSPDAPGTTLVSGETVRESPSRTGFIFGALMAPTSLGVSATAVSLPQLGGELNLAGPQTAWVLASYALALAIGLAVSGRIADLRGLRVVMLAGLTLLVIGSLVSAASFSFEAVLLGRLVQGLGGAAVSIAAIGTINTLPKHSRRRALAVMTAVIASVSGCGSLIGGILTESVGWRAVLALPALSVLSFLPAVRRAPRSPSGSGRLDVVGAFLVAGAAGLAIVLLQASSTGLSGSAVSVLVALTAALLSAIALNVRRRPEGLLPLPLIQNVAFWRYSLTGMGLCAPYFAMIFAGPLLLATREGWGPLQIGFALLPAALTAVAASRLVGMGVGRYGDRRIAAALACVSCSGVLTAGLVPGPTATIVGLSATVAGFAGAQVALVGAVPSIVPAQLATTGTSLVNFLFNFGGAIGSAVTGGLAALLSVPAALVVVAAFPAAALLLSRGLVPEGARVRTHGITGASVLERRPAEPGAVR